MDENNTLVISTAEEKLLKRKKYLVQWRIDNKEKIYAYRQANLAHLAELQRKYDKSKRNDPRYREMWKARQTRYLDKKKLNKQIEADKLIDITLE